MEYSRYNAKIKYEWVCNSTYSSVEDIDLRVTRQEGPGYSYGHCQKPGAKLEDGGPEMGLRPGYGLKPVVTIIIMVELVV